MKMLLAALGFAACLAGPALADPARLTDIIDKDGKAVDTMLLRYGYDASWKLDDSHFLLRNVRREYLLLTFAKPCESMTIDRATEFVPALSGHIFASQVYEARDAVKSLPACDIARIQLVETEKQARALAGAKG
jgi:hypothetical protein